MVVSTLTGIFSGFAPAGPPPGSIRSQPCDTSEGSGSALSVMIEIRPQWRSAALRTNRLRSFAHACSGRDHRRLLGDRGDDRSQRDRGVDRDRPQFPGQQPLPVRQVPGGQAPRTRQDAYANRRDISLAQANDYKQRMEGQAAAVCLKVFNYGGPRATAATGRRASTWWAPTSGSWWPTPTRSPTGATSPPRTSTWDARWWWRATACNGSSSPASRRTESGSGSTGSRTWWWA